MWPNRRCQVPLLRVSGNLMKLQVFFFRVAQVRVEPLTALMCGNLQCPWSLSGCTLAWQRAAKLF